MNYYNEIKQKLVNNEIYEKIKDYSKERNRVVTYFEIGKLLNAAGSKYGDGIIQKYSQKLVIEVGKKYSERTLRRMRQLYTTFNNEIWSPVVTRLTWSHYIILMSLNDDNKINYYLNITINQKLSKRELQEKIKNKEYERLDKLTKNKLINQEKTVIFDFIKNPILIKNSHNYNEISEKILKQLILENIDIFLNELGEGFCYIKNEYKIKLGDRYNYIDLLLYNIKYKCYIVVELKVTELKAEYIGQITKYINYIDKNIKTLEEDRTIGIIICKKENKFIMEYCSDNRIITKEYILI